MGNYISCTLSVPVGKNPSRVTRVIFPSGEIRRLNEPTKAAEIMLEIPNYFLVNTKSLRIGKRFLPLNADEDLQIGNIYVFFSMKRLNAVVAAVDMGALFLAANSTKRITGGTVRISPEYSAPKLNLDDIEEFSNHRLSMCRSKKPLLETITEEPICLR